MVNFQFWKKYNIKIIRLLYNVPNDIYDIFPISDFDNSLICTLTMLWFDVLAASLNFLLYQLSSLWLILACSYSILWFSVHSRLAQSDMINSCLTVAIFFIDTVLHTRTAYCRVVFLNKPCLLALSILRCFAFLFYGIYFIINFFVRSEECSDGSLYKLLCEDALIWWGFWWFVSSSGSKKVKEPFFFVLCRF